MNIFTVIKQLWRQHGDKIARILREISAIAILIWFVQKRLIPTRIKTAIHGAAVNFRSKVKISKVVRLVRKYLHK